MQIDKFKSVIRSVIREELDYYFNRFGEQLHENLPKNKAVTRVPSKKSVKREIPLQEHKKSEMRSKFMQAISEGFNEDDLKSVEGEGPVSSILDENNINALRTTKNKNTRAIGEALTRDYSQILKKVDQLKSKKVV
jgi:hypothetical protein